MNTETKLAMLCVFLALTLLVGFRARMPNEVYYDVKWHDAGIRIEKDEILVVDDAVNTDISTDAQARDSANVRIYTEADGDGRIDIVAKDGDTAYIVQQATETRINSPNYFDFKIAGTSELAFDGTQIYPYADNGLKLGLGHRRFGTFTGVGADYGDTTTAANHDVLIRFGTPGAYDQAYLKFDYSDSTVYFYWGGAIADSLSAKP